jgi:hypothetical protein
MRIERIITDSSKIHTDTVYTYKIVTIQREASTQLYFVWTIERDTYDEILA